MRGICLDTEKGRICEGSYPEWYIPLKSKAASIGETFNVNTHFTLCSPNYEAVRIGSGVIYYDPNFKNTRIIRGDIFIKWNYEGCNAFGLPENDTTNVTSFSGKQGQAQRFNKGIIVNDFYYSDLGIIVLEGTARNLYESKHGLGNTGFPKRVYTDVSRGVCVETEKEIICEREEPGSNECPEGMIMYTNPNNAEDKVCAKKLHALYFNQYYDLNIDGTLSTVTNPTNGSSMCGAASAVVSSHTLGAISANTGSELKEYTYKASKSGITKGNKYQVSYTVDGPNGEEIMSHNNTITSCSDGVFGITGALNTCNQNSKQGIEAYVQMKGLKVKTLGWGINDISKIKTEIDAGRPIIFSIDTTFGHISTIIGYTETNKIIVIDTFTDLSTGIESYTNKGNGAIYSLTDFPFSFTYFLSIYK